MFPAAMRSAHFNSLSDEDLLSAMQEGETGAYNELFARHWERLFVIAQSILMNEDISKDVLQDVFLSFWQNRLEIYSQNIAAYLGQAVRYRVYKEIRDGRTNVDYEIYLASIPNPPSELEVDFRELRKQVEQCTSLLPTKCQEIFRLSRFEYKTNKEIAEYLNRSQRTVETHISNALSLLRKCLNL